jgi:hypothetical protein
MVTPIRCAISSFALAAAAAALPAGAPGKNATAVTPVQGGAPRLPILSGSVQEPAQKLQHYLEAMSGARLELKPSRAGTPGIYVGLVADFPWLQIDGADRLGPEVQPRDPAGRLPRPRRGRAW